MLRRKKKFLFKHEMELSPPFIVTAVVGVALLAFVLYLILSGHGYAQIVTRKPMDSHEYIYARATGMKAVGLRKEGLRLLQQVPEDKIDLQMLMRENAKLQMKQYQKDMKDIQRKNRSMR
jgi:hypothetical protein